MHLSGDESFINRVAPPIRGKKSKKLHADSFFRQLHNFESTYSISDAKGKGIMKKNLAKVYGKVKNKFNE